MHKVDFVCLNLDKNPKGVLNGMNNRRVMRIAALILVLAMMPLWMISCGKIDSKLSGRLAEAMIGDGGISTKENSGKSYIDALDSEASSIKSKMNSGTWPESALSGSETIRTQHYKNTYVLAKAWATKKSDHYHSKDYLNAIKDALEVGYTTLYGEISLSEKDYLNTMNNRLDAAEYLIRTLLILNDAGKISGSEIEKCLAVLDFKFPSPSGKGVDLIRTSYITLGCAVLRGNVEAIEKILTAHLINAFSVVNDGDGLYADGSYLAYNKTASSSSYGTLAFAALTEIAYAVKGTKVDFAEELKVDEYLYNWAVKSIIPSLYNGTAFAGTVSSYISEAEKYGGRAVSALLMLSEMLDDEKSAELKSIIKGYSESNSSAFITGLTSYGMCVYQDIESDKKIEAKNVVGAFSFAEMDKLTLLGNKYAASLSLSSLRSAKYETRPVGSDKLKEELGAVNGNGWYTGDGMLLIYTPEYSVNSKYWKYVNSKRIPGTTVDSRDRISDDNGGFDGDSSNAGSVVLDAFAVSSSQFSNNNADFISDLSAKKSVFFFGNKIVCLGADIKNTIVDNKIIPPNNQTIETIVENIYYNQNTSVATSMDYNEDITFAAGKIMELPSAVYVMKYGGIYVPADKNEVLNGRLNSTDGGNFLELWLDHGITPENATYEYVIIPSSCMKMEAFFEFAAAPDYSVVSNTEKVQAVKDDASGVTGYTFWEGASCNGITTDFTCNMIVKETDSAVTIAISDFTHFGPGNKTGDTITLTGNYTATKADTGLTFNGNTITVDRAALANGQTLTITLSK